MEPKHENQNAVSINRRKNLENSSSQKKYDSSNSIHVTGFVEDPWYYVSRSLVVVAPIRIGAGIQNKVLEAMAIGKPVVATSKVLRGLNVAEENIHLLRADSAEQFADEISRLIDNPNLRTFIGKNGQLLVKKYFMWNNIETRLLNVISEALKRENYSENK
jgi:glycosyltransferase involved in cell wall biosynthesis